MSSRENSIIKVLKGIIIFLVGFLVGLAALTMVSNLVSKSETEKNQNLTTTASQSENTEAPSELVEDNTEAQPVTEAENQEEEKPDEKEEAQTEESTGGDDIDAIIAGMSLHEKVCQMFIVTPEGLTGYSVVTEFGDSSKAALDSYPVGGIVYFSQNLETQDQTRLMLTATQEYASSKKNIPIFLCVDEEGGKVARCGDKLGVTKLNNMYTYKDQGSDIAYQNAATIGTYLKDLGFNLDFAPVADTWSNPSNTVIGQRAYSDDFNETAQLIPSAVQGFHSAGIKCALKHFPGHGDTATDSHAGTAITSKTMDQLEKEEFLAFQSGISAGADMVMVGHITVTSVTNEPASISSAIVNDELRGKLGYDGLVVTDALNMGAVSGLYDSGALAVKCVKAGDDLLLMPSDFKSAVAGVESAVESGDISEERINESVRRILKVKLNK